MTDRDCPHGSLRRACDLCDADEEFDRMTEEIARLRKENAALRDALDELLATVKGECPSLLNEDSGASAVLLRKFAALDQEVKP